MITPSDRWAVFYRVVRRVPKGRVTTYGEVAMLAGAPGYARHVGHALAALRGTRHGIPWQRVLARDGARRARIAILDAVGAAAQRDLLAREGVSVSADGRVDLQTFGWRLATKARAASRAGAAGGDAKRAASPSKRSGGRAAAPRSRAPRSSPRRRSHQR